MKNLIRELREKARFNCIAYDPWNAWETATELEHDGFEMLPVRPYYSQQSAPTKSIEKDILEGAVDIDLNPITAWMYRNVVLDMDSQENVKINKDKSADKIDGVAAQIMSKFAFFTVGNVQSSYLFEDDLIVF